MSVLWRAVKHLCYIEDAWCLKVNACLRQLVASVFGDRDLKMQAGDSFMILVNFLPEYVTLRLRNIFLQIHFQITCIMRDRIVWHSGIVCDLHSEGTEFKSWPVTICLFFFLSYFRLISWWHYLHIGDNSMLFMVLQLSIKWFLTSVFETALFCSLRMISLWRLLNMPYCHELYNFCIWFNFIDRTIQLESEVNWICFCNG